MPLTTENNVEESLFTNKISIIGSIKIWFSGDMYLGGVFDSTTTTGIRGSGGNKLTVERRDEKEKLLGITVPYCKSLNSDK